MMAALPEMSTWGMMLLWVIGVGLTLVSRSHTRSVSVFEYRSIHRRSRERQPDSNPLGRRSGIGERLGSADAESLGTSRVTNKKRRWP